jgi:hypothetical protein
VPDVRGGAPGRCRGVGMACKPPGERPFLGRCQRTPATFCRLSNDTFRGAGILARATRLPRDSHDHVHHSPARRPPPLESRTGTARGARRGLVDAKRPRPKARPIRTPLPNQLMKPSPTVAGGGGESARTDDRTSCVTPGDRTGHSVAGAHFCVGSGADLGRRTLPPAPSRASGLRRRTAGPSPSARRGRGPASSSPSIVAARPEPAALWVIARPRRCSATLRSG